MLIADDALVLGLTGAFGSGCSTLYRVLQEMDGLGFRGFSLSTIVREEYESRGGTGPAKRAVLQDIGNELRSREGADYLAKKAVARIQRELHRVKVNRVVFDSLRNAREVDYLHHRFRRFLLVAVDCAIEQRWYRVKEKQYDAFDLTRQHFNSDETRDRGEDRDYGQQVQLCIDDADIVLRNDDHLTPTGAKAELERAIAGYIELLIGEGMRQPSLDEILMAMAYTVAYKSHCPKRGVGAVIAEADGTLVSAGFNDNPEPVRPCVQEFADLPTRCYKDYHMSLILDSQTTCPACHKPMAPPHSGRVCQECGADLHRELFPNRGMEHCPAIHAEVRALTNARGRDLSECVLYTTTFPCFDCAKQIVHAGIRQVVYVEPYVTAHAAWVLNKAGVKVKPFEGVKAKGFSLVFGDVRRLMESRFAPTL